MNDLLKYGILFSEGKRDFEKSHFLGLFKNQLNEKQLLSVFAGIPSGQRCIRELRMFSILPA
jgi:hypothetical protein